MDILNITLIFWLGLSALAFVWFGGQAAWFYWHLPHGQVQELRGRPKIVYIFGAITLWTLVATFGLAIVLSIGRLLLMLIS